MKQYISPWGEFEMDPSTGLPVAPEDTFFRVRDDDRGYWFVELCRRRKITRQHLWGAESLYETEILCDTTLARAVTPMNRANVLNGAACVLTKHNQIMEDGGFHDTSFVGEYPPKKLA